MSNLPIKILFWFLSTSNKELSITYKKPAEAGYVD
jgi:hypothetical protein